MALLELESLTKRFGRVAAVDDLSLTIDHGLLVCLLGPSGCGKTTTLRLIAGFVDPDAGSIKVGGRTISAPGRSQPPERRNMSMIFQSYALWPHMTIFENIAYGLTLRRVGKAALARRVAAILEATHLVEFAGRYPSERSAAARCSCARARS
jgi:iron(III) transport system ATP-binding protein